MVSPGTDNAEPRGTAHVTGSSGPAVTVTGGTSSASRSRWWQCPPAGSVRSQQFARIVADAEAECATRRARVLKHPDLVAALTRPPLSMRPECWNGYVPPAFDDASGWRRNTSPSRAALVEICAAAYEREKAGDG